MIILLDSPWPAKQSKQTKNISKWGVRPWFDLKSDDYKQQRATAQTFRTYLFASTGIWQWQTHLRTEWPQGGLSQVASLGGMTLHWESECSPQTKLSAGSSSPALATRTALRGRKDMVFTTPPHTGESRDRRMGCKNRQSNREDGRQ